MCRKRHALSVRPTGRTDYRLSPTARYTRSFPTWARFLVAQSRLVTQLTRIGSKSRVPPLSALRSRTSMIRCIRLRRLLPVSVGTETSGGRVLLLGVGAPSTAQQWCVSRVGVAQVLAFVRFNCASNSVLLESLFIEFHSTSFLTFYRSLYSS